MAAARRITLFLLALALLCCSCAFADEASLEETVRQLQKRIEALEKKVAEQDKYIATQNTAAQAQQQKVSEYEARLSQFEEKLHRVPSAPMRLMEGLELGVGATLIVQGTDNVNEATSGSQKKNSRSDGSYSADITLSKEFEKINSRAFVHLEGGQGDGLEDNLTLYSNVNRDADNEDRVHLTEVWYEQGFFKDKAAITFGKLDPTAYFDQSEVANDETTQFLGRIFRNSPTVEFPDNTAGIRLAYLPVEWLELGYGVFDGNSDWEKIGDNLFNIGHFKTNFFNLPGNYRFYGWNNNLSHTKWLDTEKTKEAAYGFGLSLDQKVTDIITLFTRYGWQNPKVYNPEIMATGDLNYSLEHSWSAGLQIEGRPWGRQDDIFALAVGEAIPSKDYKNAGAALDPARRAKAEGHLLTHGKVIEVSSPTTGVFLLFFRCSIEAYYRIHLNDYLSFSPDFQYIWSPFGKDVADDTDSIFVGGMRAQVDF